MSNFSSPASRREFLRRATAFGAYGAAAPLAVQLATLGAASAQTANDYRALVCIFLYGGNDGHNTVIPYDKTHHDRYAAARPALALPRQELENTALTSGAWATGRSFALHPAMASLKPIFDEGKLSVGFRVGTMNAPTTREDFFRENNLPAKLFSHNDQFNIWQSMLTEGAGSGWGGRIGDVLASSNGAGQILTNITVGASAVFSSGAGTSFEYAMTPAGPVSLAPVQSQAAQQLIERELARRNRTNLLRVEVRDRYQRNAEAAKLLSSSLTSVGPVSMPATPLGASLGAVARVITARQSLGVKRQVFFVSVGGFDTHSNQRSVQDPLLANVADSMEAFQRYLDSMGLGQQVTTFTASDFGRALTGNVSGSDHGWGSHVLVMGGAVKPRSSFGELPTLVLGGSDDIGQGRLLPAVSVDQYGATLARWMGVKGSDMTTIFPNINNFNTSDLGFLGV
jgi:uncharacterized protein (DUF1501 family)